MVSRSGLRQRQRRHSTESNGHQVIKVLTGAFMPGQMLCAGKGSLAVRAPEGIGFDGASPLAFVHVQEGLC